MKTCSSEPVLTTCRHSERKRGVGSEERAGIVVFLPLDCVARYFAACRAVLSRLELAHGLPMVMSSRRILFLRRGGLSKRGLAFVVRLLCMYMCGYISEFV